MVSTSQATSIRLAQALACCFSWLLDEVLVLLLLCSVMVSVLPVLLVELTILDRVWLWFNTVVDVLDVTTDPPLEVEPVEEVLVRALPALSSVLGITGGLKGISLQVTSTTNQSKYENK